MNFAAVFKDFVIQVFECTGQDVGNNGISIIK